MEPDRKLTIQELAELALFLADEGIKYQNGSSEQIPYAAVRYAQSLSVFRSLNAPNETWIAFLLYNIGLINAHYRRNQHARAFLESAACIEQRLGKNKDAADMLWKIGQTMSQLGFPALAQPWLEKAVEIYQALGLAETVATLQRDLQKMQIGGRRNGQQAVLSGSQPHRFEIQVLGQSKEQFLVMPDGILEWKTIREISQPLALGLTGWEVICIDIP